MAGDDAPKPATLAFTVSEAASATKAKPPAEPVKRKKGADGKTRKEEAFDLLLKGSSFDLEAVALKMSIKETTVLSYVCEWITTKPELVGELTVKNSKALKVAIREKEVILKRHRGVLALIEAASD
jgi:hypothetical protein